MSSYQPPFRVWNGIRMWYPKGDNSVYILPQTGKMNQDPRMLEHIHMFSTGIKKDNDLLWDGDILQYDLPILSTPAYAMIGWYDEKACWGLYNLNGESRVLTLYQMTRCDMWKKAKKVGNRFENKSLMERVR